MAAEFLPSMVSIDGMSHVMEVTDGKNTCKAYYDWKEQKWVGVGHPQSRVVDVTAWRIVDWASEYAKVGAIYGKFY